MAVGCRIPVGGSIRSLSPIEGKFRVKGPGARASGSQRGFWTGMRLKAIKAGVFSIRDVFQQVSGFFHLAEGLRLSTMRIHKSSVFVAEKMCPA